MYRRVWLLAFAALLLPAASQGAVGPRPGAEPAKTDAALLQDEAKATGEFQRRLRDLVTVSNGVLMVEDRSDEWSVTTFPLTALWSVDCTASGLAVTFGSGTGDTDNGVAVPVTNAPLTAEQCRHLAPAMGQTVLAIIKGE